MEIFLTSNVEAKKNKLKVVANLENSTRIISDPNRIR